MAIPSFLRPTKAPADVLPYGFNWQRWLARNATESSALVGDVITAATIVATPAGLTIGTVGIDPTGAIVTAMFSGGADQDDYTLVCTIHTQAGLTAVAEETLQVRADAR